MLNQLAQRHSPWRRRGIPGLEGFCSTPYARESISKAGKRDRQVTDEEARLVLRQVVRHHEVAQVRGAGRGGVWRLTGRAEMGKLLPGGATYAVEQGHGATRSARVGRCG